MAPESDVQNSTVLVVLAEVSGARACLDAALAASHALPAAEILVFHVRVNPYDDIMPSEDFLTPEQIDGMQRESLREGRILHDIYMEWLRERMPVPVTRWLDVEGGAAALVRAIGSQSMLNVIMNPERLEAGHARKAFHACIFETHRPLLVVPRSYRLQPLRRALVGWRNTAPTRRALEAAIPWLATMEHIVVLHVGKDQRHELQWAEDFLRGKGLQCELRNIDARDDMTVGMQILREAGAANADWLITGAFRFGEIIEWIFGGVTEDLLHAAALPIFMHH